jgi:hypothetical protein
LHQAQTKDQWHALADVVRQHRDEHARTLLETACQEAATWSDYLPVLKRFLCQPTSGSKKRQSPVDYPVERRGETHSGF